MSCVSSIALGYLVCAAILSFQDKSQEIWQRLTDENGSHLRLLFEVLLHVVGALAVISVRRGFSLAYALAKFSSPWFFKGAPRFVTPFCLSIISTSVLAMANVAMSLPQKGVEFDGQGVTFCIEYNEGKGPKGDNTQKPSDKEKVVVYKKDKRPEEAHSDNDSTNDTEGNTDHDSAKQDLFKRAGDRENVKKREGELRCCTKHAAESKKSQ